MESNHNLARNYNKSNASLSSESCPLDSSSTRVQINEMICCEPGQIWGIVGATAAGKSTLLLGILGELQLIRPHTHSHIHGELMHTKLC